MGVKKKHSFCPGLARVRREFAEAYEGNTSTCPACVRGAKAVEAIPLCFVRVRAYVQ